MKYQMQTNPNGSLPESPSFLTKLGYVFFTFFVLFLTFFIASIFN